MKKRITKSVALFMSFLMVMTAVPLFAFAAFAAEPEIIIASPVETSEIESTESAAAIPNFTPKKNIYTMEATIIACDLTKQQVADLNGKIVIPEKIGEFTVTSIGEKAFDGMDSTNDFAVADITEIVLPESLKTIEKDAFYHCKSLKSITVPKGVVIIGERAIGYSFTQNGGAYTVTQGFEIVGWSNTAAHKYSTSNQSGIGFTNLDGSTTVQPVTGIFVNPETAKLRKATGSPDDEFITLSVTFQNSYDPSPTNPTNKLLRWFSDDDSIASVDSNGKVTGHSAGVTTIRCISSDCQFTDTCTVTVDGGIELISPWDKPVVFNYSRTNENSNYGELPKYLITDAAYVNEPVEFVSSDTSVVDIGAKGGTKCLHFNDKAPSADATTGTDAVIGDYYAYTSTITVRLKNHPTICATVDVTVRYPVTVDTPVNPYIKWNYGVSSFIIPYYESVTGARHYHPVMFDIGPASLADKSYTITSSNPNVITFDAANNRLVPQKNGRAVLTAKLNSVSNVQSEPIVVFVVEAPETAVVMNYTASGTQVKGLMFIDSKEEVAKVNTYWKKDFKFTPTFTQFYCRSVAGTAYTYNPTNQKVIYTSSNPNVATVDASGNVTGRRTGTAIITATSAENSAVSASYTVQVKLEWYQIFFYVIQIIIDWFKDIFNR